MKLESSHREACLAAAATKTSLYRTKGWKLGNTNASSAQHSQQHTPMQIKVEKRKLKFCIQICFIRNIVVCFVVVVVVDPHPHS